jgi:hypothetical protein
MAPPSSNPTSCSSNSTDNVALLGTASISDGGADTYGPSHLNDGIAGEQCSTFSWITAPAIGSFMRISWTSPQLVSQFQIYTPTAEERNCNTQNSGRNLKKGTLQYFDGTVFQTILSFDNMVDGGFAMSWEAVSTTILQIIDLGAGPGRQSSNPIVYEWAIC